jgi:hypothetical protein
MLRRALILARSVKLRSLCFAQGFRQIFIGAQTALDKRYKVLDLLLYFDRIAISKLACRQAGR